ncbi:MAG: hypothetical protein U0W40_07825 [Acidimicrobiia bacterium]
MGLRSRRLRRRPGGGDHEGRPAHQGPHPRLQSGEIAIIKHRDLDRVATDSLIEKGAAAVVNCDESVSGALSQRQADRVVSTGIPLLDRVDPEVMDLVQEGDVLTIEGDEIRRNGELLATGHPMTAPEIEAAMDGPRHHRRRGGALRRTRSSTCSEAKVFFEPLQLPPIHTKFEGAPRARRGARSRLPRRPPAPEGVHP